MRYEQFEHALQTAFRVNKAKARRLYDAGGRVILYMIHDNPESPYVCGFVIEKDMYYHVDRPFDAWVNEYEYCNSGCGRGCYAKFFVYIEEGKKCKR